MKTRGAYRKAEDAVRPCVGLERMGTAAVRRACFPKRPDKHILRCNLHFSTYHEKKEETQATNTITGINVITEMK